MKKDFLKLPEETRREWHTKATLALYTVVSEKTKIHRNRVSTIVNSGLITQRDYDRMQPVMDKLPLEKVIKEVVIRAKRTKKVA